MDLPKGPRMKHHRSTPGTTLFATIEPLEDRQLLSVSAPVGSASISVAAAGPSVAVTRAAQASSNASLQGTYTGTVSLNRPAPALVTGHELSFVMTVSTRTANGQISGSLTLGQLGNFSFSGTVHKQAVQLLFDAGSDSGKLIASVSGSGKVIQGRLDALVSVHRLDGTVRATSGAALQAKPHTTHGTGAGGGGTSATHTPVVRTVTTTGTSANGTTSSGNTGATNTIVNGGITSTGTFIQPSVNFAQAIGSGTSFIQPSVNFAQAIGSGVSFVQPTVLPSIGSIAGVGTTQFNGTQNIISTTVPVNGGVFASTTIL